MKTQNKKIIEQLQSKGYITRNWALSKYIGRLASRMNDLKNAGWKFDTQRIACKKPDGSNGWDFKYILK